MKLQINNTESKNVCMYVHIHMYILIIICNLGNQPYDKLMSTAATIDNFCIAFGLFFTLQFIFS